MNDAGRRKASTHLVTAVVMVCGRNRKEDERQRSRVYERPKPAIRVSATKPRRPIDIAL